MKKAIAPLQTLTGQEAVGSLVGTAWYPQPDKDAERLMPYPTIEHHAKFRISKNAKIFAIGSCFARELEKAMFAIGMNVISYNSEKRGADVKFRNITNKYTTASIKQDLKLAVEGFDEKDIASNLVNIDGKGRRWSNYQFGGGDAMLSGTQEEVAAAYRGLLETMSKITECELVVLTLGLVEVWYDRLNKKYLNVAPHKSVIKSDPARFEMQVQRHSQVIADLNEIYKLLKANAKVEQKMLLTVSPVPLHATYRGQDVLQANCYSKSTLRSAAEEFLIENPEVGYFPSYEMVTLADPKLAWAGFDFRHVSPQIVAKIMEKTVNNYLTGSIPSKIAMQELVTAKKYKEITSIFEELEIEPHPVRSYVYYYAGVAYWNQNDMDKAQPLIDIVLNLQPRHLAALTLKADMLRLSGETSKAVAILEGIRAEYKPAEALYGKLNAMADVAVSSPNPANPS